MRASDLIVVLCVTSRVVAGQRCYSMDGQALDSRYQPCYPQAESSACCMLNGTQGDNQQNDLCLDSGLCQSTSGWFASFLYINGCTDKTGKADGCPKLCSFMGNQYSWSVLQCEPGKFCCRAASDTSNCCNKNTSMISTSHIGNLLLPGSTAAINTTFNFTTEAPLVVNGSNSTCSSNISHPSLCQADHSAAVGGAVGGVLGAALIGALVALAFALRSRKQYSDNLASTQATLSSTEIKAAEEKANLEKQLEERQTQIQNMPPNYPITGPPHGFVVPTTLGYTTNSGSYPPAFQPQQAPTVEMPQSGHQLSELGEDNDSRAELMSAQPKT